MNITFGDVVAAIRTWATSTRDELARLGHELRSLWLAARRQWASNPQFRSTIVRAVGLGLAAAMIRGPRATVLWLASMFGELLSFVANALEQHPVYSPAH